VANVSVRSPGAGLAGLEIRGRGRSPAVLASTTGNRDLGRGNIGRQLTAANQFTWTVNNNGDLASGTVRVTRGSVNEFQISGDTCSNTQIAGHGTCQMQIAFVAVEPPGARTDSIVVTDTASGRSVTLALTAVSVRVANPGQSCINAECASGTCTDGVCCDRACDRVCQQCSAAGVCIDQTNQEQCGNGAARCFGVDQCKLPAGQACGADGDCGGGLLCKTCGGGGRQCTPAASCCGTCPGNQACVNGSCGCSAQQIDCGGGLCISRNTANVCCPVMPGCPSNLPGCTNDGRCVQCTTNAHCGSCSTCNVATNTCTPRPRGTIGFCQQQAQACDGNGGCFTPQCGINGGATCSACNVCQNFQCVGGNEGSVCNGNGQCASGTCRPGQGSACTPGGTPCANNLVCTDGRCATPGVGAGVSCTTSNDCASGLQCVTFFSDPDNDGFASPNATTRTFCAISRTVVSNFTQTQPRSTTTADCAENNADAHPGQANSFTGPIPGKTTLAFDYNCDGVETADAQIQNQLFDCTLIRIPDCEGRSGWANGIPACGQNEVLVGCAMINVGSPNDPVCSAADGILTVRSPCR
jgi:hypothetical protein